MARERLTAWLDEGNLTRPMPNLRDAVEFYGDPPMLPPVVAALERMAPPVRDFVLEHAAIFGTGWTSRGWTGSAAPASRPRLIRSGASGNPEQIRNTMLHEAAHCWLEPIPAGLVSAAGTIGFHELGQEDATTGEQIRAHTHTVETRARTLTADWVEAPWLDGPRNDAAAT